MSKGKILGAILKKSLFGVLFLLFCIPQVGYSQVVSLQVQTNKSIILDGDSLRVTITVLNPTPTAITQLSVEVPWATAATVPQTGGVASSFSATTWSIANLPSLQLSTLTFSFASVNSSDDEKQYLAQLTEINGAALQTAVSVKAVVRVNHCLLQTTPSIIFDCSDTTSYLPMTLSLSSSSPNLLTGSWTKTGSANHTPFSNISVGATNILDLAIAPFGLAPHGNGLYDITFTSIQDAGACGLVPLCYSKRVELINLSPRFPDSVSTTTTGFLCSGDSANATDLFTTLSLPDAAADLSFRWWVENMPIEIQAIGGVIPVSVATAQSAAALANYRWTNTANTPKAITFKVQAVYTHGTETIVRTQTVQRYIAPEIGINIQQSPHHGVGGTIQLQAVVNGGWGSYDYTWSTASHFDTTLISGAGTYTVTVEDRKGCQKQVSHTYSPVALTASVSDLHHVLCHGDSTGSISVSVSGGVAPYAFLWSNGETTSTLVNIPAGNYTVVVTDSVNAVSRLTVQVTQPATPLSATISSFNPTCADANNGKLVVLATGGTQPYEYSWNTGATIDSIFNLGTGNYSVTVSDSNACSISLNASIQAPIKETLALAGSDTICLGESDTLYFQYSNADAAYDIHYRVNGTPLTWRVPADQRGTQVPFVFTPSSAGNYTITLDGAEDSLGCSLDVSGSYTLVVTPQIALQNSLPIHHIARNTFYSYTITPTGGASSQYSYQLLSGTLPQGIQLSPQGVLSGITSLPEGSSANIELLITEPNSCPTIYVFQIQVVSQSSVLYASKTSLCAGDSLHLTAQTTQTGNLSFHWTSTSGFDTITDSKTLIVHPTSSRTYEVEVLSGGVAKETLSVSINVHPKPTVDIDINHSFTNSFAVLGDSITFVANPNGYPYYQFDFNGEKCPDTVRNEYSVYTWNAEENNTVAVVVRSVEGCESVSSKIFMGPKFNLPSMFYPESERLLPGYDIDVFNRWGELLYSGKDGWDAIYLGSKLPQGTYFYVLHLPKADGSTVDLKYHVFVKY